MKNDNSKKRFLQKMRNKYRLIIYNDTTFQTTWSTHVTRIKFFLFGGVIALLFVFLTAFIIVYTPVNRLVPGFYTTNIRNMIVRNAVMVDSLEDEINMRDGYLEKIKSVIKGDVPDDADYSRDTTACLIKPEFQTYDSIHDSIFKQKLLEEKINLSVQKKPSELFQIHFFTPLKGMISQKFDRVINHLAVDIVGLPDSRISATLPGTVIFAGWTTDAGYVICIQHQYNLLSVYKHNSQLLKEEGDHVEAGEVVSLMGNTGELTTGPHLHFELWYKGIPLDPEKYIDF